MIEIQKYHQLQNELMHASEKVSQIKEKQRKQGELVLSLKNELNQSRLDNDQLRRVRQTLLSEKEFLRSQNEALILKNGQLKEENIRIANEMRAKERKSVKQEQLIQINEIEKSILRQRTTD